MVVNSSNSFISIYTKNKNKSTITYHGQINNFTITIFLIISRWYPWPCHTSSKAQMYICLITWIQSHLSNCSSFDRIATSTTIFVGIPQGYFLGPLLFLLFTWGRWKLIHLSSGVAWHGPSRAMARPLEMLLGPRWGQGPTFNILISGSSL